MYSKYFITSLLFSALLCFVCSGCSTVNSATADEGVWRDGRVERIAFGRDLENIAVRECVVPLPREDIQDRRFAVVHYHQGRWSKYRTVAIPSTSTIKIQDEVRINIADCSAPLLPIDKYPY